MGWTCAPALSVDFWGKDDSLTLILGVLPAVTAVRTERQLTYHAQKQLSRACVIPTREALCWPWSHGNAPSAADGPARCRVGRDR